MLKRFFALGFALVLGSFVACDDGSSANHNDDVLDESSSSVILSGGSTTVDGSSGSAKSSDSNGAKSSSSVMQEGTSAESNGSSDALGKSSSSDSVGKQSSSSEESAKMACTQEGKQVYKLDDQDNRIKYICTNGFWEPLSSSSSAQSSSSYFNMDDLFNPEMSYGNFTDPRDNQTYKTVVIHSSYVGLEQFEVFAQNLNYGTQVKLGTTSFDDSKVEKFCYNDDPLYCENDFGGLYSWSEALGLPRACDSVLTGSSTSCPETLKQKRADENSFIQGVCPEGWHVMISDEWNAMRGGSDVSSIEIVSKAMRGNNTRGFSALLGGGGGAFSSADEYVYKYMGEYALFWYPNEYESDGARSVFFKVDGYSTSNLKTKRFVCPLCKKLQVV